MKKYLFSRKYNYVRLKHTGIKETFQNRSLKKSVHSKIMRNINFQSCKT